jgi:transposase
MLKALDDVRKEEQKEYRGKELFNSRKLLYIPETKQSEEQRIRVMEISSHDPKTGRAFRMVQALDLVYASEGDIEAGCRFDDLFRWLRRSRLDPMKRVALTLKEHKEEILYIFKSKLTNAICEGINSLIQAAKRKARGYHTFEGYSAMIYLVAGKLQLACPNPLRQLE